MLTNSFSYNGSGEALELNRNSVGTYFVMLHGLPTSGPMGQLQVTAYGSGSEYCTVNGHAVAHWPSKDVMYAVVNCWNNAGTRADSLFTMLYTQDSLGSGTIDNAFLYANDVDNNSYTPPAAYQFSTTSTEDGEAGRTIMSDPVRGSSTSIGSYFYELSDFATRLPLVTAREATGGLYCKVAHRAFLSSKVSVYCFEPASGRRANSKWYGMALDPG